MQHILHEIMSFHEIMLYRHIGVHETYSSQPCLYKDQLGYQSTYPDVVLSVLSFMPPPIATVTPNAIVIANDCMYGLPAHTTPST